MPFLIALPMGGIALYLRTRIEDTPAFRDAQAESDDEEPADLAAAETDIMQPEEGPLGVWDMLRPTGASSSLPLCWSPGPTRSATP